MELYIQLAFASLLFHLQLIYSQFPQLSTLLSFNDKLLNSRLLFQLFTPTLVYLAITDNLFYPLSFLIISLLSWSSLIYLDSNLDYNLIFKSLKFNEELYSLLGVPLVLVIGITLLNLLSMLVTNVIFGGVGGLPGYIEVKVDLLNLKEVEGVEGNKEGSSAGNSGNNISKTEKDNKSSKYKGKVKKSSKDNNGKKKVEIKSTTTNSASSTDSNNQELVKPEVITIQSAPNLSSFHQSLARLKLSFVDTLISMYLLLTYDTIFTSLKLYSYIKVNSQLSGIGITSKALELGFIQLLIFYLYRQLESTTLSKLTFYFKTKSQFLNHIFYLELIPILMYSLEVYFIFNNLKYFKFNIKLLTQVFIPLVALVVKFGWNIWNSSKIFNSNNNSDVDSTIINNSNFTN